MGLGAMESNLYRVRELTMTEAAQHVNLETLKTA